jgi:hypothetical protein
MMIYGKAWVKNKRWELYLIEVVLRPLVNLLATEGPNLETTFHLMDRGSCSRDKSEEDRSQNNYSTTKLQGEKYMNIKQNSLFEVILIHSAMTESRHSYS